MIKLLIIDDDPDYLNLYERVLTNSFPGSLIIKALDGHDGIRLAVSEKPDIILIDIIMTVMDGFKVSKKIRSNKHGRHVPIIMLTGVKADKETRIKAFDSGADTFLPKPTDPNELKALIEATLKKKKESDNILKDRENTSFDS
jgi:DNA-binding response OmpR family regulator